VTPASRGAQPAIALQIADVSKTFPGQRALDHVSVEFRAGTVTALLGHNGSGKSTLIKLLAGFHKPDSDSGSVAVNGQQLKLPVAAGAAYDAGLRFVHQDLALIDEVSIADNFAMVSGYRNSGHLAPVSRRRQHEIVLTAFERLGIHESPEAKVASLGPTTRAMVAVARAIQDVGETGVDTSRHVLIVDEPTASLPHDEVDLVLDVLRAVRATGAAVIYVTHRVEEVLSIADEVTVLRGGQVVEARPRAGLTAEDVVRLIAGKSLTAVSPALATKRLLEPVLELRDVTARRLRDVSLTVGRGEVVGVAGLTGCGRSELTRIITGAQTPESGQMFLGGAPLVPRSPRDALDRGVASVPQNRASDGCVLGLSVQDNLSLGTLSEYSKRGRLNRKRERERAVATVERFNVVPADVQALMRNLSGGNQQKVIIAKALRHSPQLLVLDEPMQGIDVGAKREIAQILRSLAEDGMSVIVGSADIQDMIGLCNRVFVLSRGRLAGTLSADKLSEDRLLLMSSSLLQVTEGLE
jgi:ribose transport system ATP-binding protein